MKSNFSFKNVLKCSILCLVTFLIAFFLISKKENLDMDETYTYGLSNSSFQLHIEDFTNYKGIDLLHDYAMVKDGQEFDIKNVFFNQMHDTHPPLYYMFVNFICSINKNTFSMWYGLIVNIVFLIFLYFEMRYLFYLVTANKLLSTIIPFISFFTYAFTNEIVFTRMYVMLSAISIGFICLIIYKINAVEHKIKNNDLPFLISFYAICVLGILTQYHFIFVGAFFSFILLIYLIKNKNIKLLLFTFISGILSILTAYFIFPAMLKHFFGEQSLHALNRGKSTGFFDTACEILLSVRDGFFSNSIYIFIIIFAMLIMILLILLIRNKLHRDTNNIDMPLININGDNNVSVYTKPLTLFIIFTIFCIYYFIFICLTVQFAFDRYLYNIYPIITIVIISSIYLLISKILRTFLETQNKKYLAVFNSVYPHHLIATIICILLLSIMVISTNKKTPDSLNVGDESFHNFLYQNKDTKTILLYKSMDENGNTNSMSDTSLWKLPYPLFLLRDMENLTFVDTSIINKLTNSTSETISGYDDLFVIIYTTQDDQNLLNILMSKNNVSEAQKIYFTNYIHVYRLTN